MKKILLAVIFAAIVCVPLSAMGVVSNLKAKTDAAKAEEKEMIESIDMLENYDVLIKMDVLMDISKSIEKQEADGEGK